MRYVFMAYGMQCFSYMGCKYILRYIEVSRVPNNWGLVLEIDILKLQQGM